MKKSTNDNASYGGKAPPQFIKRRLTDAEMDQAKAAADTFSDVGEIFTQMIAEGYKVSASHDEWGGGTQVFMTPFNQESPNLGFTLSARGPNLIAAIAVLAWKHYTLFSQDWPKTLDEVRGPSWG